MRRGALVLLCITVWNFVTPSCFAVLPMNHIEMLARVADQSVSNRDVILEVYLDNPTSYSPENWKDLDNRKTLDANLNSVLTQVMVAEENKILAAQNVNSQEVEERFRKLKLSFGAKWNPFLAEFELNIQEVKNLISRKIVFEKTLADRVRVIRLSQGNKDPKKIDEGQVKEGIESWIKQLQSRYNVSLLKSLDFHKTEP